LSYDRNGRRLQALRLTPWVAKRSFRSLLVLRRFSVCHLEQSEATLLLRRPERSEGTHHIETLHFVQGGRRRPYTRTMRPLMVLQSSALWLFSILIGNLL